VFYTGPIDAWFGYKFGRMNYRTVTFERIDAEGDYQGSAVINYTELKIPHTRIHEHKHFTPWEDHARTVRERLVPDPIHVELFGLAVDLVPDEVEPHPGDVDR